MGVETSSVILNIIQLLQLAVVVGIAFHAGQMHERVSRMEREIRYQRKRIHNLANVLAVKYPELVEKLAPPENGE